MSLTDGDQANATNFNAAYASKTSATKQSMAASLQIPVDEYHYIGESDSDGSIRIGIVGSDAVIQARVSGTWTTIISAEIPA